MNWIIGFRGGKTHLFHWIVSVTLANDVKIGLPLKKCSFKMLVFSLEVILWCRWKIFV